MTIWNLFSKRNRALPDTFEYDVLPTKLRNQIVLWWKNNTLHEIYFGHGATVDGYHKIREIVRVEHGRLYLVDHRAHPNEDLVTFFLHSEETEILLDIVELSARFIKAGYISRFMDDSAREAIAELNHRFRENGIGYEFQWDADKLVCVKNLVLHEEAVRPALQLLSGKTFKTANEEYLRAHKHFRKAEFDDCLTECCKAFESTIKIVCTQNGWSYKDTDAAQALVRTYMHNTRLPPFFETLLLVIATLRNKFDAHGQGTQQVAVPEHLAKYSLHATAAAIVLLVDAAR
jgi:hypothetical protein